MAAAEDMEDEKPSHYVVDEYSPKKLNFFAGMLYRFCIWLIHMAYGFASKLLPPSLAKGCDDVMDALVSDETEKELLGSGRMASKVGGAVKFVVGVIDFTIAACVLAFGSAAVYLAFRCGLFE